MTADIGPVWGAGSADRPGLGRPQGWTNVSMVSVPAHRRVKAFGEASLDAEVVAACDFVADIAEPCARNALCECANARVRSE